MKKHLLFLFIIATYYSSSAQTVKTTNALVNIYNKYLIKIDTNIIYNVQATKDYIKIISGANSIIYNSSSKYYEVLTKKDLQYNIISGKLQKNATPMADFIFVGRIDASPSVQTNTISTQ